MTYETLLIIPDFLCQRTSQTEYSTVLLQLTSYLFAFNLLFGYGWAQAHGIDTSWIFYTPLPSLFGVEYLYRHYRHRYMQRHHLPGPYGNGTIDP